MLFADRAQRAPVCRAFSVSPNSPSQHNAYTDVAGIPIACALGTLQYASTELSHFRSVCNVLAARFILDVRDLGARTDTAHTQTRPQTQRDSGVVLTALNAIVADLHVPYTRARQGTVLDRLEAAHMPAHDAVRGSDGVPAHVSPEDDGHAWISLGRVRGRRLELDDGDMCGDTAHHTSSIQSL